MSGLLHAIAAGEPSKAVFYLAGGLLALWAVVLTAIGLARADFPASQAISRGTMAITAALVAATMVTAIATASRPQEHEEGAPAPGGAGAVLAVSADPSGELAFQQKALTARAGRVTVELRNDSTVQHDARIAQGAREVGGTAQVAQGTRRATVQLEPGRYTFYCSVPGHRDAGMEGPLTVR